MPDRRSKGKLTDVAILRDLIARYPLAHDPAHPNALELDATHFTPDQSAARIAEHLRAVCQPNGVT